LGADDCKAVNVLCFANVFLEDTDDYYKNPIVRFTDWKNRCRVANTNDEEKLNTGFEKKILLSLS
jgi:hypothetical protein